MKRAIALAILFLASAGHSFGQSCSSCQNAAAQSALGSDVGVSFSISMGSAQFGQSAGNLTFASITPTTNLYSPALLQFSSPTRTDVTVITNASGIRQVNAPQALADVNVINTNSYTIGFYYASQVGALSGSVYSLTGSPYMTWAITNNNPSTTNQLQVSKISTADGLLGQWTYSYNTNNGVWSMVSLGGLTQVNSSLITLGPSNYQIIKSIQATNGPIIRQVATTYQIFSWGSAPIQVVEGSNNAAKTNAMTYYDVGQYGFAGHGSPAPIATVSNWDGFWVYYNTYDSATSLPTYVYSAYGDSAFSDTSNSKLTVYDYTTGSVAGSGDSGIYNTNVARSAESQWQGGQLSQTFTFFPSIDKRIDVQPTSPWETWNQTGDLYTTNTFYTSGGNQYLLKSVVRPDLTMTTYDYRTNSAGTYQTNITATGQPDPTFSYIVDGTTNYSVVDQFGNPVVNYSADIASGIVLQQDVYGNFDSYGRPQQVSHLDGTTEYMTYACCGLQSTTDRDGVYTEYLYDAAKRQVGYIRNGITYTNVLDAAGQVLQTIRIGTDSSQIIMSQSQYDLTGEVIVQTNALNGVTYLSRTNDATTGGLIRTTVNPDGGTITNAYYLDRSLKKTSGTAARPMQYILGLDGVTYPWWTRVQVKLSASGGTNEWVQSSMDVAGRLYRTVYPASSGFSYAYNYYNALGQLTNTIDADGVSTFYAYNAKGEQIYSVVDVNQNGAIDWTGSDPITYTARNVTNDGGVNVRKTQAYVWSTIGSSTTNLISTTETSVEGLTNRAIRWNNSVGITNQTVTKYGSSGYRYVTNTAPDGSYAVSTYQYGLLLSVVSKDSTSTQLSQTTYSYDAHGRQYTSTDARNGTTTYAFNNADQVSQTTTPSPGGGGSAEVTSNAFDNMGRTITVTLPDSSTVNNQYYATGDLELTYGSRTYPAGYTYDAQGRMATLTTWTNFATSTGARITTWAYDSYRGFLSSKTYDSGTSGPHYTYTGSGRLQTRLWARGTNTTYTYDGAGNLSTVIYNDGATVGITNGYDRRGRMTIVSNGPTVCNLTYNDQNEALTEAYTGGPLGGISVTNGYDSLLRRINNVTLNGTTALATNAFSYDYASRLETVTDGTNSATYTYLANSPLVSQINFAQSGTTRMTTTKQYDYLNRLTSISSANASSVVLDSHGYTYNSLDQRTATTGVDNSTWNYQYDSLGQVTSGVKNWSDGTVVAGQQFGYTFDDSGNRETTTAGGDQWGLNLRSASYSVNNLNQYTSRTVPGAVDIIGAATNTATVTVNDQPTYRKSNYYRMQLSLNNGSGAVWQPATNLAVLNEGTNFVVQTNITGNVFLPQTPENYTYDADGNTTQDGRWTYTWDAENRLVNMTSLSGGPTSSKLKLDFTYDYEGRRIQKIVSTNNSSAYVAEYTNKFAYDGWNLVATLNPTTIVIDSFVWGLDLSGSTQGASGEGGLLATSVNGTNCFVAFDGNGNISALVNSANGNALAQYEYSPFGEAIRADGLIARVNPLRFSAKYQDDESDLLYYDFRYYNAITGRWLTRDPIADCDLTLVILSQNPKQDVTLLRGPQVGFLRAETMIGGQNLYGFVMNDPVKNIDAFGLSLNDLRNIVTLSLIALPPQYKACLGGCKTQNACWTCCGFVSVEGGILISAAYATCEVSATQTSPILGSIVCHVSLVAALKKLSSMDTMCKSACAIPCKCGKGFGDPKKFTITVP